MAEDKQNVEEKLRQRGMTDTTGSDIRSEDYLKKTTLAIRLGEADQDGDFAKYIEEKRLKDLKRFEEFQKLLDENVKNGIEPTQREQSQLEKYSLAQLDSDQYYMLNVANGDVASDFIKNNEDKYGHLVTEYDNELKTEKNEVRQMPEMAGKSEKEIGFIASINKFNKDYKVGLDTLRFIANPIGFSASKALGFGVKKFFETDKGKEFALNAKEKFEKVFPNKEFNAKLGATLGAVAAVGGLVMLVSGLDGNELSDIKSAITGALEGAVDNSTEIANSLVESADNFAQEAAEYAKEAGEEFGQSFDEYTNGMDESFENAKASVKDVFGGEETVLAGEEIPEVSNYNPETDPEYMNPNSPKGNIETPEEMAKLMAEDNVYDPETDPEYMNPNSPKGNIETPEEMAKLMAEDNVYDPETDPEYMNPNQRAGFEDLSPEEKAEILAETSPEKSEVEGVVAGEEAPKPITEPELDYPSSVEIQSGDRLESIAKEILSKNDANVTYDEIREFTLKIAEHNGLEDADQIMVGQTFDIPSPAECANIELEPFKLDTLDELKGFDKVPYGSEITPEELSDQIKDTLTKTYPDEPERVHEAMANVNASLKGLESGKMIESGTDLSKIGDIHENYFGANRIQISDELESAYENVEVGNHLNDVDPRDLPEFVPQTSDELDSAYHGIEVENPDPTEPKVEDVVAGVEKPEVEQPTAFEEKPNAFEEKPTAFEEKPNAFEEKPTAFEEKPTAFEEKPTAFEEKPTVEDVKLDSMKTELRILNNYSDSPTVTGTVTLNGQEIDVKNLTPEMQDKLFISGAEKSQLSGVGFERKLEEIEFGANEREEFRELLGKDNNLSRLLNGENLNDATEPDLALNSQESPKIEKPEESPKFVESSPEIEKTEESPKFVESSPEIEKTEKSPTFVESNSQIEDVKLDAEIKRDINVKNNFSDSPTITGTVTLNGKEIDVENLTPEMQDKLFISGAEKSSLEGVTRVDKLRAESALRFEESKDFRRLLEEDNNLERLLNGENLNKQTEQNLDLKSQESKIEEELHKEISNANSEPNKNINSNQSRLRNF